MIMPDSTPSQESVPTLATKPGWQTSEVQITAAGALALAMPVIENLLTKKLDTRFEVACLTLVVINVVWARTLTKLRSK